MHILVMISLLFGQYSKNANDMYASITYVFIYNTTVTDIDTDKRFI